MKQRTRGRFWLVVCAAALAPLATQGSSAFGNVEHATWLSTTDGNWSDPSRWSSDPLWPNNDSTTGTAWFAHVPFSGDAYTITIDQPAQVNSLNVSSTSATIAQSAHPFTVGRMGIGQDGGSSAYHMSGGTLQIQSQLAVGGYTNDGSFGGNGTFIQSGGYVRAGVQDTRVGFGGNGTFTIDGPNSIYHTPPNPNFPLGDASTPAYLGVVGTAQVSLKNGASVTFGRLQLGIAEGHGTININSGAQVYVGSLSIGAKGDWYSVPNNIFWGHGVVSISDPGTKLTIGNGALIVGDTVGGAGRLALHDGTLQINPGVYIPPGLSNLFAVSRYGVLDLNGGTALIQRQMNVSGGAVNLAGSTVSATAIRVGESGSLNVSAGTLTISGTINVEGGNYLQSGGVVTAGGLRVVNTATISSNASLAGGSITINGPLTVTSGLTVQAASGVVPRVRSLSISGSGFVDLADNGMIVDYTGTTPIQSIRALIASGFDEGSWSGPGIRSSVVAQHPHHGLGYADASALFTSFPATFAGQAVDETSVLIRYTRAGDANLDGVVNLLDFNRLAANFGSTGAVWSQGDFNYDGLVNLQDFNSLAANFGLTATGTDVTPDDWSALASAVPEPGALAYGAVFAGALLAPRRRHHASKTL